MIYSVTTFGEFYSILAMLLTHVVVTFLSCLLSFLDKLYIPYFKKSKDFLFTCLLSFLLPEAIIVALEIIVGNTCVSILIVIGTIYH